MPDRSTSVSFRRALLLAGVGMIVLVGLLFSLFLRGWWTAEETTTSPPTHAPGIPVLASQVESPNDVPAGASEWNAGADAGEEADRPTSAFSISSTLPLAERSDALDQALRQPTIPIGFAEHLLSVALDRATTDADWRDYCVQVMPDCHNRLPSDDPRRSEIVAALRDILDESANAVAGTALLGLDHLGEADAALSAESARAAVRLASDDAAHPSARVTALRVAASHGAVEALPAARVLAQVGETPLLRLAAIATLGDLGDASDRELLLSLSISSDKRSRSATASAVERLDHRLSSPPATP